MRDYEDADLPAIHVYATAIGWPVAVILRSEDVSGRGGSQASHHLIGRIRRGDPLDPHHHDGESMYGIEAASVAVRRHHGDQHIRSPAGNVGLDSSSSSATDDIRSVSTRARRDVVAALCRSRPQPNRGTWSVRVVGRIETIANPRPSTATPRPDMPMKKAPRRHDDPRATYAPWNNDAVRWLSNVHRSSKGAIGSDRMQRRSPPGVHMRLSCTRVPLSCAQRARGPRKSVHVIRVRQLRASANIAKVRQ